MKPCLLSLHIRDFAIIQEITVEFSAGFTVFSGETGAGKSILFDALGLVLGERADVAVVRDGASRSDVTAIFDVSENPAAREWLEQRGLDDPDDDSGELVIRRQIQAAGTSRAFINGAPAKLNQLKALSEHLLDIHGQHAHQSLLKPSAQRALLDSYGQLDAELSKVKQASQALSAIEEQIERLSQGEDLSQRRELLRYQLNELNELEPSESDFTQLEHDYRVQSEAEHLLQQAGAAHEQLYAGESSLYDQIQGVLQGLDSVSAFDKRFAEAFELCQQAQIQLKEAAGLCEDLSGEIEPDPQALRALSQRIDSYQSQARKHHTTPEGLGAYWQQLIAELAELESSEHDLDQLSARLATAKQEYADAALVLSKRRQQTAQALSQAITEAVRPLGLAHARCEVDVSPNPAAPPGPHGQDRIELRVAMNPGQSAGPLSKVASGGELARTSLAIQVVCLDQSPVPVLLFDEVDVGIGGGVAETVGRQLKALAARYQVFCVTHQPQVAALADTHFQVSKQVSNGQTRTGVIALENEARIDELARMLGGVKITDQTRAHAREMLDLGQQQA